MKAFVPFLLGLSLLGSAAQGAVKQRKPKGKELALVKQALQGKQPIAKKTLHVSSMKGTGTFLFTPVMDFAATPPLQLHLIQNGKILHTLAPPPGDKRWPILRFEGVLFKDVNGDGFEDVVTLTRYLPVKGPQKDQAFNQAALYLSRQGKSFELLLGEVHDALNAEPPPPSLGEVQKRLKKLGTQKLALPAQSSSGAAKP
jgi:hypothetical protein